ncbi:Transcription initiation factor IIA small chain (TFIIA 13.5 kDa subunit), partial [Claviceps pusilla]
MHTQTMTTNLFLANSLRRFTTLIGLALTDTLDDLISEERINPQLAMKILGNFDQAITESLQKNVKSRLQFK